jgi:hypothetical protein
MPTEDNLKQSIFVVHSKQLTIRKTAKKNQNDRMNSWLLLLKRNLEIRQLVYKIHQEPTPP